jgi:alanine racemase
MTTRASSGFHYRRSVAEIDLRRIENNFTAFKALVPEGTFICPMVKANAYGHGDVEVARALRRAGAKFLGVALVEEGETLRRGGDREPILIFGPTDLGSAESILRENLTPVLSAWDQIESLESAYGELGTSRVSIHLEFNTGMNRLGFEPDEVPKLKEWLARQSKSFRLDGVCTHLFSGNDAGEAKKYSDKQLSCFSEVAASFPGDVIVHALNSSSSVNIWKRLQEAKDVPASARRPLGLRPGIGIYGVDPGNDENASIGLKPVMSLKTHIIGMHRVAKGEKVSYGPTWTAERDSVIGTVPFGYADGYRRALSNKADVLLRGQRVKQVGTVCMDYFMIDLTDLDAVKPVKPGEEVVLLGEQGRERITADELANLTGTIAYEILTGISDRVTRTFTK